MTTVTDIKKAVKALPENELISFSSWFDNFENERWDKHIEDDQKSGPLCDLMAEAMQDYKAGKCKPL